MVLSPTEPPLFAERAPHYLICKAIPSFLKMQLVPQLKALTLGGNLFFSCPIPLSLQ